MSDAAPALDAPANEAAAPGTHALEAPALDLPALDLAALLCSRVCHDVIGPVGAIVNGLEILEDEKDEATRGFALDMVTKSARQASARLQFARIALGAAGSAGASIDLAEAEKVARGLMQGEKAQLAWDAPRAMLPKNKVKLLLNLVPLAATAIPRGGSLGVSVEVEGEEARFTLRAKGLNARVPPHAADLLAGRPASGTVDAHSIQAFYAGLVARAADMRVGVTLEGDEATFRAVPSSGEDAAPAA